MKVADCPAVSPPTVPATCPIRHPTGLSRYSFPDFSSTRRSTLRQGGRELHIEGDWLLIYRIDHGELCLVLTRTGSHDALFGRGGKNF
ncbi:type II toxin-antitoxin system mRNA interferase toxin, RelE/StbE family [Bifidobacterium longum]|uniref:type II toxin-antitoxin system mRNA interferase toxin, RelE/StbE family n=1 Tax=Bifidobacterium longum TaxID=216816 RepID=UPI0019293C2C|nr:type II toxin-antitoxin system mRNA interferase toxin, RelE/StbE family [Bifidobacterium longum subsp. longum]MBL3912368.1 type II toxin-antitoxin system mRNA interferase toxin, RelE/StbE family [Bifidobacterium longum subsp. longum]